MRGSLIETLVEWQLWRTTLWLQIKAYYTLHKAKVKDILLTMKKKIRRNVWEPSKIQIVRADKVIHL